MKNKFEYIKTHLINEAFSLLSRLSQVQPFELTMPMVTAANISPKAMQSITLLINKSHKELNDKVKNYINWLKGKLNGNFNPEEAQKQFTLLKLRYNSILDELDIFADVLCQRAEHGVGVWVSGLDRLAEDGIKVCEKYSDLPQMIVFLERGHGAAIRRAKTRFPGGDENPVGVIQIPRERMVGDGIAASLIHEVGHQAAALLDLVAPLKAELKNMQTVDAVNKDAWNLYERWISEILSDFWSMAHLGIAATLGLFGVVSLPSYFQFRIDADDPHPAPYIRALISCMMGVRIFPHPQWQKYINMWDAFYPQDKLEKDKVDLINKLKSTMGKAVEIILNHKPKSLKGLRLIDIFPVNQRQPSELQKYFEKWKENPGLINAMSPTLVFAMIGQAKADNKISAELESRILSKQLIRWAFRRTYPVIEYNKNLIFNKNHLQIN
jgi:hypothetical protein